MLRKVYVQPSRNLSQKNIGVTNEAIRENPLYIAHDLVRVTADHGLAIQKSHIARFRRDMGWVAKGTKYSQRSGKGWFTI